ncbi:hypothetical protein Tsubulata_025558 [Turnera subulata]|uniref:Uncharacterized protein n=1 Tax=Turnera subulata TaxID=218843 RepID=A0A9Q0GEQ6_9ROSI|nr:hypothetical protein Tsubulata_025558 [Turnera subulata]
MEIEASLADVLIKVLMFVLVQVLVYIILSNSSDVFSKNKMRSFSFKAARSRSIRRALAVISDMPFGTELSPSSRGFSSSIRDCTIFDDDHDS